jgi:hypothetical protein
MHNGLYNIAGTLYTADTMQLLLSVIIIGIVATGGTASPVANTNMEDANNKHSMCASIDAVIYNPDLLPTSVPFYLLTLNSNIALAPVTPPSIRIVLWPYRNCTITCATFA